MDLNALLARAVEAGASDIHLKVGRPPMIRHDGAVRALDDGPSLRGDDLREVLELVCTRLPGRLADFEATGDLDVAYTDGDLPRFRVNAFRQRGNVSIALRVIPFQVRTIDDLGLPEVIRTLATEKRGIVLLTGTTGSGKSTTLAAMIDHINSRWARHIITLEDPIEYLQRDKLSIINQREVGQDTESFGRAMRRVLRQDPDVIFVGEMRDEETVRTALSAAETGHLVLSTLHTLDATETVNRIIDFFPPHLQQQARVMLASTLRGVVGQRLVQHVDGKGRVAVCEVLVVTGRVQDLILNPTETGRITEVISEGEFYGMQTFDQALLKHVMAGNVAEEVAFDAASSPHDFKLMLQAQGQRASGIEQVMQNGSDAELGDAPVEGIQR
jgi:twitching motility protein PilT